MTCVAGSFSKSRFECGALWSTYHSRTVKGQLDLSPRGKGKGKGLHGVAIPIREI